MAVDTSGIPKGRGRLDGKVAIVVGGGSILPGWGNGKAAAVLYAVEGAKVLVVDNQEKLAQETVEIISAAGGTAVAAAGSAVVEADVARIVKKCLDTWGRVDVLHNNVGGQGTGRSLANITLDDWNEMMALNITSAMLSCREVVPHMVKQGGGSIINIASIGGIRHLNTPMAVYAAGKSGLIGFTQNIALHHAKDQVRANCVLPGYIDTPFIRRPVKGEPSYAAKGFKTGEEYSAARNKVIPMGRMGTGWDVAYASLFLASDEAAYVTGTTLVVDGGVTATCPGV
jgi:NAD(P)-dependent dehydrogenase (short-subunit alcohol dehydrogenase family)